jgi:membrane associated rhomboid family serine protease
VSIPTRQTRPRRTARPLLAAQVILGFVAVLYALEAVDTVLGGRLDGAGVRPREVDGLDGIVFAPFLHTGFDHLYANAVPLLLTGTFVLATGVARWVGVTALIAIASGLGVWFTGAAGTVVVGASGIILGYIGFLLARGIVEHSWWGIVVGALIGLLYGAQILGEVLPSDERISWQAHLFGFLGGVVAAVVFRRRRPRTATAPQAVPALDLSTED